MSNGCLCDARDDDRCVRDVRHAPVPVVCVGGPSRVVVYRPDPFYMFGVPKMKKDGGVSKVLRLCVLLQWIIVTILQVVVTPATHELHGLGVAVHKVMHLHARTRTRAHTCACIRVNTRTLT